jgi:hypothetical protein
VACVTGSSTGIGRAVTLKLAGGGCNVMSFSSYYAAWTALPRPAISRSSRSVSNTPPQMEDEPQRVYEFFSIVLAKNRGNL